MNKIEAIQQVGEGVKLKFLGVLGPTIILWLWQYDPDSGEPLHDEIAQRLNLFEQDGLTLKPDVRVGRAKTGNGDIQLTGDSLYFPDQKPTPTEFETLKSGDIQVIS